VLVESRILGQLLVEGCLAVFNLLEFRHFLPKILHLHLELHDSLLLLFLALVRIGQVCHFALNKLINFTLRLLKKNIDLLHWHILVVNFFLTGATLFGA